MSKGKGQSRSRTSVNSSKKGEPWRHAKPISYYVAYVNLSPGIVLRASNFSYTEIVTDEMINKVDDVRNVLSAKVREKFCIEDRVTVLILGFTPLPA